MASLAATFGRGAMTNHWKDIKNADVILVMDGGRIVELPIPTRYDESTSSLRPIPYGLNVIRMMWRFTVGHYRKLLDDHTAATGQHHIV